MSGVPQGSVLGPLLFLIYINDLDDNITSNVLKFADDTKLFRKVNTDGDKQHLQNDLDRLVKWSEKWQMLFNFGKYNCLHTGPGNMDINYKMGDTVLGTTVKEKELVVTTHKDKKLIIHLHKAPNVYFRHICRGNQAMINHQCITLCCLPSKSCQPE